MCPRRVRAIIVLNPVVADSCLLNPDEKKPPARGRFAPSPTGAPHFGTLLGALASYLHARATGAQWYVRIEDLDEDRTVPGAADEMLRALEAFGLHWDGEVRYQSQRNLAYEAVLENLLDQQQAFPCGCSRRDLRAAPMGLDGPVYPGTCRSGLSTERSVRSYRLKVDDARITFDDNVQGRQVQDVAREVGDFVIRRADGYFAYQLAVVVDDADQGMTQIVRGADLLGSTARQIYLQRQLGYPTPDYLHFPLVLGPDGKKLSKSAQAPALGYRRPDVTLMHALTVLGQTPPEGLSAAELLIWATQHWDTTRIPRRIELPLPNRT